MFRCMRLKEPQQFFAVVPVQRGEEFSLTILTADQGLLQMFKSVNTAADPGVECTAKACSGNGRGVKHGCNACFTHSVYTSKDEAYLTALVLRKKDWPGRMLTCIYVLQDCLCCQKII